MKLPFPGYSWSFTQHAVGLQPETLFPLLECAGFYEGQSNAGPSITTMMVQRKILTANVRGGREDAWRDYQQILAEIGLTISTNLSPNITLTQAGKMFLSGDIGFSELMTAQALRYQYPNGQKSAIQSRLGKALKDAQYRPIPETLIELQAGASVQIKPGLLILRVLIELARKKHKDSLSVDECQHCLIPIAQNRYWRRAYRKILQWRKGRRLKLAGTSHCRRNIQDWFKFLGKTDLFDMRNGVLSLSGFARSKLAELRQLCDSGEDPKNFWVPPSFDSIGRLNWFKFFGQIPLDTQVLRGPSEMTSEYIRRNYVGGLEESVGEESESVFTNSAPNLALSPISTEQQGEPSVSQENFRRPPSAADELVAKLEAEILLRKTKTALHDSIVRELAVYFSSQGANVLEDRDSVDLLVRWPDGEEAIFEVKTVNRRSLQDRLRKAAGQLQEYAYRRLKADGILPDKVIVINAIVPRDAWQIDFLAEHLGIGLICKSGDQYCAYSRKAEPQQTTFNRWSAQVP